MKRHALSIAFGIAVLGLAAVLAFFSYGRFSVFTGAGAVGAEERGLIIQAVLLMLIVVVPVLVLLFLFAWRYRADNENAKYEPDWAHSKMDELVWWAIPAEIVLVLGAIAWTSAHELDPHRALASSQPPLVVEVVALPWKWLFIYPEQHIATLNYIEMPTGRPVEFRLTADAPMNAFWVPSLGGMMMAMPGMVNTLNLEADRAGDYQGLSSNYSGEGFGDMRFTARAVAPSEFEAWAANARAGGSPALTQSAYDALAVPAVATSTETWSAVSPGLVSAIIQKYMAMPASEHHH